MGMENWEKIWERMVVTNIRMYNRHAHTFEVNILGPTEVVINTISQL